MSSENPDFTTTQTDLWYTGLLYYECDKVVQAHRRRWRPSDTTSVWGVLQGGLPDVIGQHFTELDHESVTARVLHSVALEVSTQGWRSNKRTRERAHIRKPVISVIFKRNRQLYNPQEGQVGSVVLSSAVRYICESKKSTIGMQTAAVAHEYTLKDCVGYAKSNDPTLYDSVVPYQEAYKYSDDIFGVKRLDFFNIDEPQPLKAVTINEFQATIDAIHTISNEPLAHS